jgi:GMP synthase-like glutamine amidotransferase
MHLHVLQHHPCESPGAILDWARERGCATSTTHLHRGEPLPDAAAVDFLVVMGGPMNIYQDRDHPWLRAERAFLEAHIASGKPAVGVCLGAQFLADALGGRVTQNPRVEIGWWPVEFTPEARERFPFLPEKLETLHWHGDTFELPAGAMRLAASAACANQGFLYDDRVLALQFHPEMTREVAANLVAEFGPEQQPAEFVQSGEAILSAPDEAFAAAHRLLRDLLDAVFPV